MSAGLLNWAPTAGLATCPRCGWRGVPTRHGRSISHECPTCESAIQTDQEYAQLQETAKLKSELGTAGRNAPCPCGSGKKTKKCHPELT